MADPIKAVISWVIRQLTCRANLKAALEEIQLFKNEAYKQTKEVDKLSGKIVQLVNDKLHLMDAWQEETKRHMQDKIDLEKWVRRYQQLWQAGIERVLDLKPELTNHQLYTPRSDPDIMTYASVIADREYYTYAGAVWEDVLSQLHVMVKEDLPKWVKEVSDCDNYADVMAVAVQLAFIKAGKQRQGAFGILHSKTHAYNFFVTKSEGIFVYEPQNGQVVGKLGGTDKPYDTTRLFFMG